MLLLPSRPKVSGTFLSKASPTPNSCLTASAHWTSSTSTCLNWRPGSRLCRWPPRCRDGHSPDILQNWGSCRLQRCFLWLVLPLSWMPGNLKKESELCFVLNDMWDCQGKLKSSGCRIYSNQIMLCLDRQQGISGKELQAQYDTFQLPNVDFFWPN